VSGLTGRPGWKRSHSFSLPRRGSAGRQPPITCDVRRAPGVVATAIRADGLQPGATAVAADTPTVSVVGSAAAWLPFQGARLNLQLQFGSGGTLAACAPYVPFTLASACASATASRAPALRRHSAPQSPLNAARMIFLFRQCHATRCTPAFRSPPAGKGKGRHTVCA